MTTQTNSTVKNNEAWVGVMLAAPEIGGSFQWDSTGRVSISTVGGAERELQHGVFIQVAALCLDVHLYRDGGLWRVSSFAVNAFRFDGTESAACLNLARLALDGSFYPSYSAAMKGITQLYRSMRRIMVGAYCNLYHPELADVSYERPSVVALLRRKVAGVVAEFAPVPFGSNFSTSLNDGAAGDFAHKSAFIL